MADDGRRTMDDGTQSSVLHRPSSAFADLPIWFIVVGALFLRIVYNLALHPNGHPPMDFVIDEREYFGAAHVLAEGRGFSFFDTALWVRPPLYVVLLSRFLPFADSNTTLIMLAQALISAVTLLPLAWLAHRVGGRAAGRWAALLGTLYLPFTLFAGLLLSETLFLFLFALALVGLVTTQETLEQSTYSPAHKIARRLKARATQTKSAYADWQSLDIQENPKSPQGDFVWVARAFSRRALLWAGAAGLLLGLCALTRATALGFVPLAALWLYFTTRKNADVHTRLVVVGTMLAVCVLILLPWIARNYRAYGQFVLVDTTSGYNLWLGSVGVRDEERLQGDLRSLRDPVERQQFAYERAWENIRNDPAGFVGKGLKESLDLWRPLFSAEERQVSGYTLGRVTDWHLYSLLVFDDILYLLILLLAIFGLFLGPPHPFKSLTLLWVLLWLVMAFVFFAVTRFRLPVVAALLPWAGVGLASCRGVIHRALLTNTDVGGTRTGRDKSRPYGLRPLPMMAALALMGASVVLVAPPIVESVGHIGLGAERWAQQEPYREAEAALPVHCRDADFNSCVDNVLAVYRRANPDIADTRYGVASALLMKGDVKDALTELRADEPPDRFESFILRGEAARKSGDLKAARSLFNERAVKLAGEKAVDWAWGHIRPDPVSTLEIGSGLDLGYINGFYGPEVDKNGRSYRWTSNEPQIRNVTVNKTLQEKVITWNGWRPATSKSAMVGFDPYWPSQENAVTLATDDRWILGDVPGISTNWPLLGLHINPFLAGGNDPRLLGIRISKIIASNPYD